MEIDYLNKLPGESPTYGLGVSVTFRDGEGRKWTEESKKFLKEILIETINKINQTL